MKKFMRRLVTMTIAVGIVNSALWTGNTMIAKAATESAGESADSIDSENVTNTEYVTSTDDGMNNVDVNKDQGGIIQSNFNESIILSDHIDDERVYSFKAEKNGYGQLNYSWGAEWVYLWAKVIDQDDNVLCEYYFVGDNNTSYEIPFTAGKTYYVYAKEGGIANPSNNGTMTFKFTPTENWEKEPNDSVDEATHIKSGQVISGNVKKEGDIDYYQFDLEQTSKVKFSLHAREENISLIDKDDNAIVITNGEPPYTYYLKKGTYYLLVDNNGISAESNYSISIGVTPVSIDTPKIKNVKGFYESNSGVHCLYITNIKLTDGAKTTYGYRVKASTSKDMKKAFFNKTITKKYTNLITYDDYISKKKGPKKAYFTVQPYIVDAFNNVVWGETSSVKMQKFKKKS